MNKIKALRIKYGKIKPNGKRKPITQEQLGIMMNYSKWQIQRLETGVCEITPHFDSSLNNIEILLRSGHVKIPK